MKTCTYVIYYLNEDQELQQDGYTNFARALHAFDLIDGRCSMQKFVGNQFVKVVKSK